jgi:hypothetical protein
VNVQKLGEVKNWYINLQEEFPWVQMKDGQSVGARIIVTLLKE